MLRSRLVLIAALFCGCLVALGAAQTLTDAQRLDQAIALLEPLDATLTGSERTSFRNALSRLKTIRASMLVEPTPVPEPVEFVTMTEFQQDMAAILERLSALEAVKPDPDPIPDPDPDPPPPPPPTEICGNDIDDDKDGEIDEGCGPIVIPSGDHGYFDALVKHPAFHTGYSLRPQAGAPAGSVHDERQLNSNDAGGLHAFSCDPATSDPAFRYDATMDAAKAAIPPFVEPGICKGHPLTRPLAAAATDAPDVLHLTDVSSVYGPVNQRQLRIGDEILRLRLCTTADGGDGTRPYVDVLNTVCVIRGQYGTAAVAHAAGVTPKISANQMSNYLKPSIGTEDGHTYVITWETYFTDSYLGIGQWDQGQKTFQVTGGGDTKLFEPKILFTGGGAEGFDPAKHIGIINARAYNSLNTGQETWAETDGNTAGPAMTSHTDLLPREGTFILKPNEWTRWWIRVEQRANDWDYFDMWVASESTEPVLVYRQIPLSVNSGKAVHSLRSFWFAFGNSNTQFVRGGLFDIVAYVRNWAVLKDPTDMASLLIRPGA